MPFCVENSLVRLITDSGLPFRRQWWRNRRFVDWAILDDLWIEPTPYGPQVVRWNYYIHIYYWSSPRSFCFVLLPSLLFTYSILYFERSPYRSSFSFLLFNALLFHLIAVFPSPLMRLFPSSVHVANTQQVLRFNSQHSASYCAGSGFEIVCSAWTVSFSSSPPSVVCRSLPCEQATILCSQSSMDIHPHISAIISAV